MKFYGPGGWLKPLGFSRADTIQQADMILLPGGADINPALYGQIQGPKMWGYSAEGDKRHASMWKYAVTKGIPIIGICRGAQLSCALNGGALFQHVENHSGPDHLMTGIDGRRYMTNSLHHQMMDLHPLEENKDYELLAWASRNLSPSYWREDRKLYLDNFKEPEIVFFNKTRNLAIQGHPEMYWPNASYGFVFDIIKEKLLK